MAAEKSKKPGKMCGYLEKHGKLTITGKWKKWWCVLEGQLLLYYKSRTQYLKLSPCCGSLNVALVKSIQPHTDRQIHVITHSQLVVLRASSKEKQQNWFLAFIKVLPKYNYEASFRDNVPLILEQTERVSKVYRKCRCRNVSNDKTYWESNLNSDFRLRKRKNSLFDDNEEKSLIDDGSKVHRISSNSICSGKRSSSYDDYLEATDTLSGADIPMKRFYSVQCVKNFTDDTGGVTHSVEKSFSRHSILVLAQSHEYLHYYDNPSNIIEEHGSRLATESSPEDKPAVKLKKKESFKFLKKIFSSHLRRREGHRDDYETVQAVTEYEYDNEKTTVTRTLQKYLENHTAGSTAETTDQPPLNVDDGAKEIDQNIKKPHLPVTLEDHVSAAETAESYSNSRPRFSNYPVSTISDHAQHEESPELPVKQKINSPNYSSKIAELNSNAYDSISRSFKSERNSNVDQLDMLLLQLSMITQEEKIHELSENHINSDRDEDTDEDPDYDYPISHASLIERTFSEGKNYKKTKNDSLDNLGFDSLSSFSITPDSLEAPWMLANSKQINRWSTPEDYMLTRSDSDTFLDSLNTRGKYTYTSEHQ